MRLAASVGEGAINVPREHVRRLLRTGQPAGRRLRRLRERLAGTTKHGNKESP